jgi:Sulfotransferase family
MQLVFDAPHCANGEMSLAENRSGTERGPVFVSIATCAYSGATLLAFLLGTHPRIATVGEMDGLIVSEDPDEYRCSCGQKIRTCEFWRAVGDFMQKQGHEFDVGQFNTKCVPGNRGFLRRLRFGSFRNDAVDAWRDSLLESLPGESDRVKSLVERNRAFIGAVLAVTGKNIFVDSSKDRRRVQYLQRFSTIDLRVIHLVRDVRGVVASRLRHGRVRDVRRAAREWVRENQRHERLRQLLPAEKSVRLRYEDLCNDVQRSMRELHDFLRVEPVLVSDFRAVRQHVVGNAMRLDTSSTIQLDERWKTLLAPGELKEIDEVAGAMNHRYSCE